AGVVLRIFERGENVGRGRESAHAARETNDPCPLAVDLENLSRVLDAELLLVDFVDDDGIGRLYVGDPALNQITRTAQPLIGIETQDLHGARPADFAPTLGS